MRSRTTNYYRRYPSCPHCGNAVANDMLCCPHCATPLLVDGYRLTRIIAHTPAGCLFEAVDSHGRRYSVKRMSPQAGEGGYELLDEELAGLEQLKGLFGVPRRPRPFPVNDECYLVSPPVPGAPLAEAVGRPWDVAQVMGFLDVALEALARMHRRGVVLRNLMPDNLIYTCAPNERLLLIDYGQFVPQRSNPLVAPELWLPIRPDQRTDLYHIGMIAYTLLSGGQPPNLRRGRRPADVFSLPKPLSDTLNQLLDPDPSRRPAHARAALTRLRGRPLLLLRLSIAGLILAVIVGAWLALAYPGILAR